MDLPLTFTGLRPTSTRIVKVTSLTIPVITTSGTAQARSPSSVAWR